jgi:hypothetical protein
MGFGRIALRRRVLHGAAALLLLCGGGLSIAAAPAQAAAPNPCAHPAWSNIDTDTGHVSSGSRPVHNGPYADCPVNYYVGPTVTLSYDCYVFNSFGNTWTHVRDPQGREGWIVDGYLNDGGSFDEC